MGVFPEPMGEPPKPIAVFPEPIRGTPIGSVEPRIDFAEARIEVGVLPIGFAKLPIGSGEAPIGCGLSRIESRKAPIGSGEPRIDSGKPRGLWKPVMEVHVGVEDLGGLPRLPALNQEEGQLIPAACVEPGLPFGGEILQGRAGDLDGLRSFTLSALSCPIIDGALGNACEGCRPLCRVCAADFLLYLIFASPDRKNNPPAGRVVRRLAVVLQSV